MIDDSTFAQVLVQESPDALYAVTVDGHVLFWSNGAVVLFGFDRREASGRLLADLIVPPERDEEAQTQFRRALEDGTVVFETQRKRKDGTVLDVDVSMRRVLDGQGNVAFVAVNCKDVSDLKRLREARSSVDKLTRLLEAAPDAMVIADGSGCIQFVNAQTELLFRYERGELLGEPVELLIPERYRDIHPAHRRRYFAEPRVRPMGTAGLVLFGRRKDGSEFPAEISLSPFESADGPMAITTIRDVTERRRAEEERAKLRQAQEAIAMRDQFLSIASHELKTPLSSMLLRVESMLRQTRAGDETTLVHVARLRSVHDGVVRLNALVTQLLDVSRITQNRLELRRDRVDLSVLVRAVVAALRDELERKGYVLSLDAGFEHLVDCDPMRIEQVITNLLSNAIKYGEGRPIEIAVSSGPDEATLVVRDHGMGIPRDQQTRIFERFERLVSERHYGGFGLGLWIAKQILDAHGATISVSSDVGAGATFTVSFPLLAHVGSGAGPQNSVLEHESIQGSS